jgi:hypothetical protein
VRPAIANERLSVNHAGQVVLKLKTPYRERLIGARDHAGIAVSMRCA